MAKDEQLSQMLEGYESPAILVNTNYEILATNKNYEDKFGEIDISKAPTCFSVSHGYTKPCDQAGEDCPLQAAKKSGKKEKVLHVHQTPNGHEHVDVEMLPIFDSNNQLSFFIELLKPVPLASGTKQAKKAVGKSPAFTNMLATAMRVAKSDADVLLLGESGTGKEVISHLIHLSSKRSKKPIVTLECSGLSETLIESELFGHKKGAFTGAYNDKIGLVEHANNGTLFLDEIGDVSLETQVKLLRLIESKTYRRVGDTEVHSSNFRLICATHKNLLTMVKNGQFRLDLYYRINVFPIAIPSLAQRLDDIPELIEHMLNTSNKDYRITESAIKRLCKHTYTGNIRELRNIITRALVLCDTNIIDEHIINNALSLDQNTQTRNDAINKEKASQTLKENENAYWRKLVIKHQDNKENIANEAGVSMRTLYRKLESL